MGVFSDVIKIGAFAGRYKVASAVVDPEELSFLQKHPALAAAIGGGIGRGLGTGLIRGAAGAGLEGLDPRHGGAKSLLEGIQDNSGRIGTGLGAGAGHYLATHESGGGLGRSAIAGTLAAALAGGANDGNVGKIPGTDAHLYTDPNPGVMRGMFAGAVGGGLAGSPDPETAFAKQEARNRMLARQLAAQQMGE